MKTLPASLTPTPADTRPEPPEKFPTVFAVAAWLWVDGTVNEWIPHVRSTYATRAHAERAAHRMREEGDLRVVGIVTVEGER